MDPFKDCQHFKAYYDYFMQILMRRGRSYGLRLRLYSFRKKMDKISIIQNKILGWYGCWGTI